MGINFGLINSMGNNMVAWTNYAQNHHVSTRETPWTDAEFEAGRETFGNLHWQEANRETHAEDYLNWRHESIRRSMQRSLHNNLFAFAVSDFNPHPNSGGTGWDSEACIFQRLAGVFEQEKTNLEAKREAFQGRFVSELDLEIRLHVIHEQFNEAMRAVAAMFAGVASYLNIDNAEHMEQDVLRIGEAIRFHIASGESANSVEAMLRSRSRTVTDFDILREFAMQVRNAFEHSVSSQMLQIFENAIIERPVHDLSGASADE
ncbi:MAG: hypothetical protein FWC70_09995 [Defluviitaleaceae bacterium]|nr:hypothetical protein [Defluviitaleaceae bacterium]